MKSLALLFCLLTMSITSAFAVEIPPVQKYEKECRSIYTGVFVGRGLRDCIRYFNLYGIDETIFKECSRLSDDPGFYCYVSAQRFKASKQQIKACRGLRDSIHVPYCLQFAGKNNLEPQEIKDCIVLHKKGEDQIDCVEKL